jgi:ribonuclease HI
MPNDKEQRRKRRAQQAKAKTPPEAKPEMSLQDLLDQLHIDRWDYLIIGDGSGCGWDSGAGWGSVLIERRTGHRSVWWGAVNRGTVNFAEIMAYLQPLNWLSSKVLELRKSGEIGTRAYRVHIITDSDYCRQSLANQGSTKVKNGGLWEIFRFYRRVGFVIQAHWIRRETIPLNCYADRLSKLVRKHVEAYNLEEHATMPQQVTEVCP